MQTINLKKKESKRLRKFLKSHFDASIKRDVKGNLIVRCPFCCTSKRISKPKIV